jgi:hypothetical protein
MVISGRKIDGTLSCLLKKLKWFVKITQLKINRMHLQITEILQNEPMYNRAKEIWRDGSISVREFRGKYHLFNNYYELSIMDGASSTKVEILYGTFLGWYDKVRNDKLSVIQKCHEELNLFELKFNHLMS